MALKRSREADIHKAVGQAVSQYEHQLTTAQSHTRKHQSAIMRSCRDRYKCSKYHWPAKRIYLQWVHPKRRWTLGKKFLTSSRDAVNTNRGTAVYSSPDQPFSSKNRSDLGTGLTGLIWSQMLLVWVFLHQVTCHHTSSTPFYGSSQVPLNRTFRCQWDSSHQHR